MRVLFCTLFIASILSGQSSHADSVKDFLVACGYGTAAGAALGLASVAFSENPSDNSMNIARGASLGLYGGIIYGLVQNQQSRAALKEVRFWINPQLIKTNSNIAQGLGFNWIY
jgi:hypothetical protein